MDRFKFRVWNIQYGFYCDQMTQMVINSNGVCYDNGVRGDYFEHNGFVIEQCTGLKDKNGNLIYEGDIVKIPDDWDTYGQMAGEEREIYFRAGGFRFKPKEHCFPKNARGHWLEDDGEFEIVGNIHEQKDNK